MSENLSFFEGADCTLRDESLVRHAYEQVVTHSSRLASYATASPLKTNGPIYDRQEMLAIDDLAGFAYHARRLIGFTGTKRRFRTVTIPVAYTKNFISINRLLDIIIHQELVETIRYEWKLKMFAAQTQEERLKVVIEADNREVIPTLIVLKSDQSNAMVFKLEDVIELFQKNVLQTIIKVCQEKGLYLEDF